MCCMLSVTLLPRAVLHVCQLLYCLELCVVSCCTAWSCMLSVAVLPGAVCCQLQYCLELCVVSCCTAWSCVLSVAVLPGAVCCQLLYCLELSGSQMLLELLMSVVCREEKHAHEEEIQASITRYVKR